MIQEFRDKYFFLSNFYSTYIEYDGLVYMNAEAAFQSAKCLEYNDRKNFMDLSPRQAKAKGRRVKLRPDWEEVKLDILYEVVKNKFIQNDTLRVLLIDTYPKYLEEGNTWNDTFYGVCRGKGQNHLGKILMRIREELINNTILPKAMTLYQ